MPYQEHEREREIKHIDTGTNPQPRGWSIPSSSWWPPGWWRWPPVMISPSDRVPEQGLDWFFVATEACSGGTSNLGLFLGISVFIGLFGLCFTRRWASRWARYTCTRIGLQARPGVSCSPHGSSNPPKKLLVPILFQKIIKEFQLIWRTLISAQKQHHGSFAENNVSPG